jgi:sterol desaturase/sphingolipid hydroxylase (fatty acid hydroxylase superfamily)
MIRYLLMALGPASVAAFAVVHGLPVELAGALGIGCAFASFLVSELILQTRVSLRTLRNDIVHAVLSAGTAQLCLLAATFALSRVPPTQLFADWAWWWQVPLIVFGTDFLGYWAHRAQHNISALWKPHAVHHLPHELYALNGLRAHPGDTAFAFTISTVWALAVGFAAEAFIVAAVLQTSFLLLQHARGRFPAWLEVAVVTPAWHAVHHDRHVGPTNLAHITTLWDRVFGTYEASRPVSLGVVGRPPGSLRAELFG